MKRLFAAMVLVVAFATPALAEGVGLGWEDGVSLKFPLEKITLQGVFNFSNVSADDNSGMNDGTSLDLAGYISFPYLSADKAKLNFFGGLGFASNPDQDTSFGIRFGLEPTVMVTNHIGVGGKLGLQFMSVGGADNVDDSGGTIIGFWGITSVHWFF